jgi:hypothetical protein
MDTSRLPGLVVTANILQKFIHRHRCLIRSPLNFAAVRRILRMQTSLSA